MGAMVKEFPGSLKPSLLFVQTTCLKRGPLCSTSSSIEVCLHPCVVPPPSITRSDKIGIHCSRGERKIEGRPVGLNSKLTVVTLSRDTWYGVNNAVELLP